MNQETGLASKEFNIVLPANDFSNVAWGSGTTPLQPTANSNFKIRMPFPINTYGTWSVSLLEINYVPTLADTNYYVYTSIVEPQVVGSGNFNLLKILPGQPQTGTDSFVYRQPYPLEQRGVIVSQFSEIEITIRDGQGNIPIFDTNGGTTPTIINLLFQRQN